MQVKKSEESSVIKSDQDGRSESVEPLESNVFVAEGILKSYIVFPLRF